MKAAFLFFLLIFIRRANAQTNLDFESGLDGWSVNGASGNIVLDSLQAYEGNHCVKISGAQTALFQRLPVSPLALVEIHAFVKSSMKNVNAYAFIRFYDSADHLLMEFKSNPVMGNVYQETGIYTESPPLSAYGKIGVEKDTSQGVVFTDHFRINTNIDGSSASHPPLYDLRSCVLPFWKSDTVYNETVLLYSQGGKPANGRLLFHPAKILSVKSFDQVTEYKPVADYTVNGNILTRQPRSGMAFKADTSFDTIHDLAWYNLQSQWITVSYVHHEKWKGPTPVYKGNHVPGTVRKLVSGSPLNVVAFGMSITRGMNVSGYDAVPPYMPSYLELFVEELKRKYKNDHIRLYNAALPGAAIDWGLKYAENYINPLKPDLVVIDFGMNDFWRLTPKAFKENMQKLMGVIKSANPNVEFLLISNMKFDPEYILASDKNRPFYLSNMSGYNICLHQLEGKGIINLDMTTLSDAVYRRKKPRDCIANPLHPNDYLARWYAQGLVALFCK